MAATFEAVFVPGEPPLKGSKPYWPLGPRAGWTLALAEQECGTEARGNLLANTYLLMLTGEIRNQIDRIWDDFWSGGRFPDGAVSRVHGSKDDFCILLDGKALTDLALFVHLRNRGKCADAWDALVAIGKQVRSQCKEDSFYGAFSRLTGYAEDKWLAYAAAAMMAEERKVYDNGKKSRVGCLIKLVALRRVLIEGQNPQIVVEWAADVPAQHIEWEAEHFGI